MCPEFHTESCSAPQSRSLYHRKRRIDELNSKKGQSEEYLSELNQQLDDLQNRLQELQDQYDAKQNELVQIQADLEDAKAKEEG